eukprot:scaffold2156_cov115-Cylindrotheca_fusiformis.AAC.20
MLANENQEDKENQPAIRESIRTTQIPSTSSSRRTKTNTSSTARKITKLEELQIRLQTSRSQRSLMSSSGSSSSSSIPSTASSSFSWRRNSPTTTLTTEQKIQETDTVHDSRLRTNPTLSSTKDKENNIDEDDKDVESQKDIESNHQLAPVKILQSSQQNIKNPYECAAKVLSFQHSTQTTFRDLFGTKGEEDDSNDDGDREEEGSCEDDIEQQQQQQQAVEASGEEEEKEEEEEDNPTSTFTTTTTTNSIIEPMNHSIRTVATVSTGTTNVDDTVRHSGEPSPPPPPAMRPSRKPFCSNEVLIGMCVFCLLLAGVSIGVIAYATYFMST